MFYSNKPPPPKMQFELKKKPIAIQIHLRVELLAYPKTRTA